MPNLKQPKTLADLSIEALGKRITQKSREAIGSGTQINISGLNDYLYAELPRVLSDRVTTRMLSEVVGSLLPNGDYMEDLESVVGSLILAITCHDISCLDLSDLHWQAVDILSFHIVAFKKLRTLIYDDSPIDAMGTLHIGLSFFKSLINFRMNSGCTDTIINTLGSCCSGTIEHIHVNSSYKVTDASFKMLLKCHKLKYLSICDNSMTAEGCSQFLKSIRQHKKSDDTEKDFLHFGFGSRRIWRVADWKDWEVSTTQLTEIANSCPKLRELEIRKLRGNLEALVSLTTLEVLQIGDCDFDTCNFEGFLRLSGSNLISLKLENTRSIDLRCILNHCVNIKRLCVWNSSVLDMALENPENAAKALQSLEDLDLYCQVSAWIEHLLYACVNVKRMCLILCPGEMAEEFILRLLSHNPLQKLTSFAARDLTMKSVNAIIDHCPLLEKLECIWSDRNGITDLEIKCLRQRIADKNEDLDIIFE